MEDQKRGRGRPKKIPEGNPHNIRCILVNGEVERLRAACEALGESQNDFTRAAVLARIEATLGKRPRK